MKTLPVILAVSLLATAVIASAAEPLKENERDQQQIGALAKEIQGQQTAITENQTKIDAKTVTIAEALRLARIYASRGGK